MQSHATFKLDALVKSVQELQQERTCLEQKLKELRNKKQDLQKKLESLTFRHGQVKDINTKMSETLNVAKHKVSQSQAQMASLEKTYIEKQKVIKELTDRIEKERKTQLEQTFQFEAKLAEVAENLRGARHFYQPENMEQELEKATKEAAEIQVKRREVEAEVETLCEEIRELELQEARDQPEVPAKDQKMVLDVFEEQYKAVSAAAEQLRAKQAYLLARLKEAETKTETKDALE